MHTFSFSENDKYSIKKQKFNNQDDTFYFKACCFSRTNANDLAYCVLFKTLAITTLYNQECKVFRIV